MTSRWSRLPQARWWHLQVLLPGLLVLFFGFRAGGYFAGTPAFVAAVLAVVVAFRLVVAERPFEGVGPAALVALAAIALYAAWTLASAAWSDSGARAQVEFDRALLYLLAIAVLTSAPIAPARLRWAVRAVALAALVVCTAGLLSRVLPDVLPTTAAVENERLAYPVTYWNALAVIGALTGALCLHLTASAREPRAVRVIAAGALPIVAATVFFTFSRGGIATAVIALVAYVVVARPRALLPALAACLPPVLVAVKVSYDADLLGSPNNVPDAAIAQGHDVAWAIAACVVAAALLRFLLLRVDDRLTRIEVSARQRRGARLAAAAVVLAVIVAALALGAAGAARDEYRGFVRGDDVDTRDFRQRLSNPGNNGRLEIWNVALDAFADKPLTGQGAGTYQVQWTQRRNRTDHVVNGHSLYLETLAELGVVGIVLVLALVLTVLSRTALRARGPNRDVYGAVLAVCFAWALHAGIDWDWEMPAVSIVPIGLGALAIARHPTGRTGGRRLTQPIRIVAGLAVLLVAITPASIAVSQARLNESATAFSDGDCARTIDSGLAASEAAGTRPEPFELIGLCDARLGKGDLAVAALENAVERDPDNWEYHYGLAIVKAIDGQDPRPEAAAALRLNPRERLAQAAVRGLRQGGAARRRTFAERAPLPLP